MLKSFCFLTYTECMLAQYNQDNDRQAYHNACIYYLLVK